MNMNMGASMNPSFGGGSDFGGIPSPDVGGESKPSLQAHTVSLPPPPLVEGTSNMMQQPQLHTAPPMMAQQGFMQQQQQQQQPPMSHGQGSMMNYPMPVVPGQMTHQHPMQHQVQPQMHFHPQQQQILPNQQTPQSPLSPKGNPFDIY
jgi:hypothetical protein